MTSSARFRVDARPLLPALALCLGLGLAACGADADGADDPGPMGDAGPIGDAGPMEGDAGFATEAGGDDVVRGDGGPATSPNGIALGDAGVPPTTFGNHVAFAPEFQAFPTWTRFDLPAIDAVGDGTIHTRGTRSIYINRLPDPGAKTFPLGTIIVKTMQTGEVFARVKRGGEYNKNGTRGWEWFELAPSGGAWVIVWRGITPPAGFCYGGIVGGACNDCHMAFAHNDYVAASVLDLEKR